MQEQVEQYLTKGFCAYESVLSASEQDQIRRALDGYCQAKNGTTEGFGVAIHPLLAQIPELAPFLAHPLIVDTLAAVLQDDVHLVHAGARVSNEASYPRLHWHQHYGWDESEVPGRPRPTRALAGFYVDGTSDESGPLIILPRRFDEPIGPMRGGEFEAWPGEVEINLAPGSISIFDTTLWHAAKTGTKPGLRRLFGAHFQGWSNPRPHIEDNPCNVPEIEEYKHREPRLRALVERV